MKGISAKIRYPVLTWSKVIGQTFSNKFSADVYSCCQMNLAHDAVLAESPNFINLGLTYLHTSDELESIFIPATIIGRPTNGSNWLLPSYFIGEVTADRESGTRPEKNYNPKSDFETRIGGVVNQYFGHRNISMSQPALDSTPLGINVNNGTISLIESITVGTKFPEPTLLKLRTHFTEQNEKRM